MRKLIAITFLVFLAGCESEFEAGDCIYINYGSSVKVVKATFLKSDYGTRKHI